MFMHVLSVSLALSLVCEIVSMYIIYQKYDINIIYVMNVGIRR